MTLDTQILTTSKALTLLGLTKGADLEAIRSAFRRQVMIDHPDRPGGDAVRFNQILAAYRYLQSRLPRNDGAEQNLELMIITPREAFAGGKRRLVRTSGPTLSVTLPAGLRTGDQLRLGTCQVEIRVRPENDISVEGDNLCLNLEIAERTLFSGGRLEFDTFHGPRRVWLSKALAQSRIIHLTGMGLPAQGAHPIGDLFVQLIPKADEIDGTPARRRLTRFITDWIGQGTVKGQTQALGS